MEKKLSDYELMMRFIIVLLFMGLASCGERKAEPEYKNKATRSAESIPSIPPAKAPYSTIFRGNQVDKISNTVNGIFQDLNGYYWFSSNSEGVYCYDGKVLLQFTTKDGLSDNQVFSTQEDKQGLIWFETAGGISFFDGKNFNIFPNQQYHIEVSSKMESDDDLWFEMGGGAYRYNQGSYSYVILPESDLDHRHTNPTNPKNPDNRKLNAYSIYCSLKDKKGNLWFGTQTLGVCRYDGNSFSWFTGVGLSGPAVRAIFEDGEGNLWFGNNGGGLFRYDGRNLVNFTEERNLGNPEFLKTGKPGPGTLARVWSINEDNNGNIWIGTYDAGVWRFDGRNLINYSTKDGLTSNSINVIYRDKSGVLWIGTDGGGVCTFNGVRFSGFTI